MSAGVASSSRKTLLIMLFAMLIFMPIILAYAAWVFRVLRCKVTEAYVREQSDGRQSPAHFLQ